MRKRRTSAKGLTKTQTEFSSWSDLPNDLLQNIFTGVDHKELFWIISSVCRSWHLACLDVLVWKGDTLNLSNLDRLWDTDVVEDKVDKMELALTRVMRSLFNHHGMLEDTRRNFNIMIFPFTQFSDKHLVYVAERTSKLERIYLNMVWITGKGFSRAIRNWKELEMLFMVLHSDEHYTHIIQETGINCRKLTVLGLISHSFCMDEYNSQVTVNNLSRLELIVLANCYIHKSGLKTVMSKCRQLFVLDVSKCRRVLEEVKVTRRTRAFNDEPPSFMPQLLTVRLMRGGNDWFIHGLAQPHHVMSVIDHLWMEDTPQFRLMTD